ncbi:MAG: POTRA domain-containing protein [Brevinematales bacterium]
MKGIWYCLLLLFLGQNLFGITIRHIVIRGNSETDPRTILFFFQEYEENKEFSTNELTTALSNWIRRLERTGWFRNISVTTEETEENKVDVSLELTERFFYTAQLFDHAIGFGKQNLWGKGKEIFFEAGPFQKKITLTDHMYNFWPIFYQVILGTTEENLIEYSNDFYRIIPSLRQKGEAHIGWHLRPDHTLKGGFSGQIIIQTNQIPIETLSFLSLGYLIDTRRGYPAFSSGWHWENTIRFYIPHYTVSWESIASTHKPIKKTWQIGAKWHHGFTYGFLPTSAKYLLRSINGLHTLSQEKGLLGDNCWDVHGEIRWKFWDVIPFLIFDIQLEAVGFLEAGETWNTWEEFGKNIFVVYGAGLRIYIDRFAIRTETGIDQRGETAVLSSFELPF